MGRTASDIMHTDFPFVDCDATVAEAEEFFEQAGLSVLPVLNPDRTVFGVLTAQNLVHFHHRPLNNPRATHAWEICDARPLVVPASEELTVLTAALLDASRSHALIVNGDSRLLGLVSLAQLLKEKLGHEIPVEANSVRSAK